MRITARRAIVLAFVSAIARVPAFLIPIVIAALFGAGRETDAYFLAYSAILLLGGTVAQGSEQAVVPFAAQEIARAGAAPRHYLDVAARRLAISGLLLWIVGLPLLGLIAGADIRASVIRYGLYLLPLAAGWCGAAVFGGALVSQWRIGTATGSMLWRGAGALVGLSLVAIGGGLPGIAVGLSLGEVLRVWWLRNRLWQVVPESPGGVSAPHGPLWRAAAAQAAASAAIGLTPVVERLLAVGVGAGAVSHLEYAVRLLIVPAVFFDGALAPLLLAKWTSQIARTREAPATRGVLRAVGRGVLLAGACSVLLVLFAPLVVRVLLAHGRFGSADTVVVVSLLRVFAVGFVATMGALLLERLFLAATRNRLLASLSVGRAVVRLGTVVALLPTRGILAFAWGYVVADWLYLFTLIALIRARVVVQSASSQPRLEET
jgi:putative peptidoglycan lipid II flippase